MKYVGSILLLGMTVGCPQAPDPSWKEHVASELPTVVSGETDAAPTTDQTVHKRNPGPLRIAIRPSKITRRFARTIQRLQNEPIDLLVPGSTGTWLESAQREGMPSASSHDAAVITELLTQALITGRVDCISLPTSKLLTLAADPEHAGRGLVVVASVGSEKGGAETTTSTPVQSWEILSCHPSLISDEQMQRDLQVLLVSFMKGLNTDTEEQSPNPYSQGSVSISLMEEMLKHLEAAGDTHLSKVEIVDLEAWSKTGIMLPATGFPQIMVDNRLLAIAPDATNRDQKDGNQNGQAKGSSDGAEKPEKTKKNDKQKGDKDKDNALHPSEPTQSPKDVQQQEAQ